MEVVPGSTSSYTVDGVDVYPAQPDVVDQTPSTKRPDFSKPPFASKPFELDAAAYRRSGPFPAQPASGGILGSVRDLTVGGLSIPAAQYDPRKHTVRVLQSVQLRVVFGGKNSGRFSPELGSPWEKAARSGLGDLVNAAIVEPNIRDRLVYRPCGEELLIVTNGATRPAADTLKAARSRAGFLTRVVEVGTGTGQIGSTPAAIQRYIRGRLTQLFCIHPSYVVFLGDDELVPTFTPTIGGTLIPSDLQYSLRNDNDELPDVAVGRIIGNDQAQVQTAVDKIVAYETTAPSAGDFLRHATIAAQFQDDDADGQENRTFIWFAERVRSGLVKRGVTVDRIYDDSPTATPLRFNDGTDLPAAPRKADLQMGRHRHRRAERLERRALPDGPSRPRLVAGVGLAGLHGGQRGDAQKRLAAAGRAQHQLLQRRLRLRRVVVRDDGADAERRRRGRRPRRHARLALVAQLADRARLRRRDAAERPPERGAGGEAADRRRADQRQGPARRARRTENQRRLPPGAVPVALLRRPDDADVGRRARRRYS